MATALLMSGGDPSEARPTRFVSAQSPWTSLGDLKTADSTTPSEMLTANGTHILTPVRGTYLELAATVASSSTSQAAVVQVFGVDQNGVTTLLLSVSGKTAATFSATPVATTTTTLYTIPEAAVGDFLFDMRGSTKIVVRIATAGNATGAMTLLARFL